MLFLEVINSKLKIFIPQAVGFWKGFRTLHFESLLKEKCIVTNQSWGGAETSRMLKTGKNQGQGVERSELWKMQRMQEINFEIEFK